MKILAVIVGADSTATCLNAAVLAAQCVGERTIEALNVVVDPAHLVAASDEVDMQRLRERWEGTASERSAACHTAFLAWNAGAAQDVPSVTWRTVVGDEEAVVTEEAKNADLLVVIAHERNMDGGDALHAALFGTQKPVLIVPISWKPRAGQRFSHIAVGFSDSPAARRAVEAATPWLKGATDVTAIRIGDADYPALKLESLLDDAGIANRLRVVPRSHGNLGHQLLTEAHQAGADMLVTGAYRHNQLIEWFAGGTTRHLLACADIPLLMIH
ncbi:nucleotide-binding universal stress UspA family protein [Novosphingobium fluoreni]|uniref:Nucleotide-binding universal stress UspA family protein n=1 Tax=Novosphingobium fluoreni TaxID=1391222 RepID=A0A7W6C2J2_9SPHN|nr:universal stress protein [Novosphingobium fluoreni]MBB3941347.1 nucleotide-binding universal stress UspA family protein [Novosphingobium fluoreni]